MRTPSFAYLLLAAAIAACGGPRVQAQAAAMPEKSIEDVLAVHNDSLMALPGVVGTAIGRCDGAPCIRVVVRDSAAARAARVAERLDGYVVRVEVTGAFRAR